MFSYRFRCAWSKSWPSVRSLRRSASNRWIHEIKFDGYRVRVHFANNEVKVFTRRGYDWTNRFKKIASDAWHISAGSAIIDGEVVAPGADGTTRSPQGG
jgi:bifunctional non-homologous end joining protein LigD